MTTRIGLLPILLLAGAGLPNRASSAQETPPTPSLEKQLLDEGAHRLARAAGEQGDARRGAIVFHQRRAGCAACHAAGEGESPLGPDLARLDKKAATVVHLVESLLEPSKQLASEYQPIQVLTTDGRTLVGLIVSRDGDEVQLRDAARPGEVVKIPKTDIDEIVRSRVSIMPSGLVNQLRDRREFLDLVRYLTEIAQQGPARAARLKPAPSQLESLAEESIDHAQRIGKLSELSLDEGRRLYTRHCVACHGTDGNKTANPLARRFALDPLKFGTDPYAMWKTISYGNGLMFPQAALLTAEERYAVVHYLREQFLKTANASQYFKPTGEYLKTVNARAKADAEKFAGPVLGPLAEGMIDGSGGRRMDYGPYLSHSIAFTAPKDINASRFDDTTERALVVRLPGENVLCYDIERFSIAGLWQGAIAVTEKTHHTSYKGSTCLRPGGEVVYKNVDDAGWAIGAVASPVAADKLLFRGHFLHGSQVLLRYDIDGRRVEELPGASESGQRAATVSRTLRVGPGDKRLFCLVGRITDAKPTLAGDEATLTGKTHSLSAALGGDRDGLSFRGDDRGALWLEIPPADKDRTFSLWLAVGDGPSPPSLALPRSSTSPDFDALAAGGPRRWPIDVKTCGVLGKPVDGYASDEITVPFANPWGSWMRTTALDFFSDGAAAVSTLSGDVWIVRWKSPELSDVTWSRFATGLYEPLGLKIVDDRVYVRGRDRITRLHDLNADGEADFYESFFQEGQIGPGYHAFQFDLQTDRAGKFYFTKSGRKSPHEGGVVRVSPDGKTSEMVCRDFRHPNGMGAGGPHDWITVADNPDGVAIYNGVALVREGGRYGYAAPRTVPMLAVLPARADSSSGGQCWADATRWGPLSGQMIHTSYSRLAMFYILTQDVKPHPNGFAVRMPLEFPSGLMRTRTNPVDGQVYVLGHKGWDTHARYDGCLCRIRHVDAPTGLIVAARATARGLQLTFGCDLDAASIVKKNFEVVREENQGTTPVAWGAVRALDKRSIEIDLPEIDKETVARRTRANKKTGEPTIDILAPLRVTARIQAADGTPIEQTLFATVNSLP